MKFVFDDKLTIVSREEDLLVCGPSSTPYIEASKEALKTSFQGLEVVNTAYVEPFNVDPYLSSTSLMMAKTMIKEGYKYSIGLGKNDKGSIMALELTKTKGRYGLGYNPTQADKWRLIEERIERSRAKLEGRVSRSKEISLRSLE